MKTGRSLERPCFVSIQRLQRFFNVPFHFDFPEDFFDLSVFADDEGAAFDSTDFFAVHILILHHPVFFTDRFFFVAQQGKRQTVFVDKLIVRGEAVPADS